MLSVAAVCLHSFLFCFTSNGSFVGYVCNGILVTGAGSVGFCCCCVFGYGLGRSGLDGVRGVLCYRLRSGYVVVM